jgi:hypothetical protein
MFKVGKIDIYNNIYIIYVSWWIACNKEMYVLFWIDLAADE